uniref:RING-type E3 ubiquitin transferase n=1 Tax=Anas platyrhynchos platyrhynchos TaxID=8840 RepID=A0A493SW51_ANAPP
MASEAKDVTCPVCQGAPKEPSYVLPCLHRFCFGCIMRWAKRSSTCPLCRQRITSICYSIWAEDDFLEVQLVPDAENSRLATLSSFVGVWEGRWTFSNCKKKMNI